MRPIKVIVDTHLRIRPEELPDAAQTMLWQAMVVSNDEEPNDDPDIILWGKDSDGFLTLPRGFALKLRAGLKQFGYMPVWDDRRAKVPVSTPLVVNPSFSPFPYQARAVARMWAAGQGIYNAPTGSGKTVSAGMTIAKVQQRTLVLVDKMNLVLQWKKELDDVLQTSCGTIGDNAWWESDVTIATRQSIWAKREQLGKAWFANWGCVFLDECHAVSAQTVRELMQMFPAFYRLGLSATPDRHSWLMRASRSIIGEILCRTTDEELEAAGRLVRPEVIAIKTPFFARYKRGSGPAEFAKLVKRLRLDEERNKLFGHLIGKQRGHTCLVQTDQLQHAHDLAAYALAYGWPQDRVMMLTSQQKAPERMEVMARAGEGDVVVFSTIGKEALDIPRLDRFFLVWPTKNDTAVTQMAGRIRRVHEEKETPVLFDFWDHRVSVLNEHFSKRRGVYDRSGFKLTVVDPDGGMTASSAV